MRLQALKLWVTRPNHEIVGLRQVLAIAFEDRLLNNHAVSVTINADEDVGDGAVRTLYVLQPPDIEQQLQLATYIARNRVFRVVDQVLIDSKSYWTLSM